MKQDLKQTNTVKEAFEEIERLDELFYKEFNRNARVDLSIFSAGTPNSNQTYGISLSWDEENEKDAEFYKAQVLK